MEQLILVRHGEYFRSDLTEKGRAQIRQLAERLKLFVTGRVHILSTDAIRGVQSADILAQAFGVGYVVYPELFSDSEHLPQDEEVYKRIVSLHNTTETIILVTHLEYVRDFPKFYGNKGLKRNFGKFFPQSGQAVVINCKERTAILVKP